MRHSVAKGVVKLILLEFAKLKDWSFPCSGMTAFFQVLMSMTKKWRRVNTN